MAAPPPTPSSTVQGEALLQSLGYRQELKRKINVLGNLALVLSDITPTASLLIVGTVVIASAGTGSIAAYLIGCFLAPELLVVLALAISGLVHLQQPLSIATSTVMTDGKGGLMATPLNLVIAAIAVAMFSVNGYDSAINFSEETEGEAKHVGRAVVVAAAIGIAYELGTFLLVFFGVPDLKSFLGSATPLLDAARSSFGETFFNIVAIGAIVAIFNACLAITLQFARIVWAAGRDRAWPEVISAWIGKVDSRRGAPWVATLIVGVLATILSFQGTLVAVVTFTAVLLIVLYALICISALVSRYTQKDLPRPWKMPLWPVPPVIGLVGCVIALTQQKIGDLVTVAVIFIAGLIYYYAFIRPRGDRYWNVQVDPNAELQKLHRT